MSKLKLNVIYNFLYQFFVLCFPLIVAPYLSRTLGANGIGIYSYNYSIAYYFVSFAALGLSNYGTKVISSKLNESKEVLSKTFCEIYCVQFIFAILSIILYVCYLTISKFNIYSVIFSFYVLSSLFDITWFFFGIEDFKSVLRKNILIKIITTILIFSFIHSDSDIKIYCLIMSISFLISQLLLWIRLKRYVQFVKVNILKSMKNHLPGNFKLFIPVIAVSIYKYMDKIMLGSISSKLNLGYYENVEKIVNIPVAFITALGTVMLSRISMLHANGNIKKREEYLHTSIVFTGFLSFAMIFGILGIADLLIPIYFGKGFLPCINLCYYMIPTVIFLGLSNVIRTQYLIPLNEEKIYILSVCYGAIINFILNSILIPIKSASGAAFSTLIAEVVVFLYQFIKTKKKININKELKQIVGFMIIGIIMYITIINIHFFSNNIYNLLIRIFIGSIIYICLSLIYISTVLKEYKKYFYLKN